MMAKRSTHEDRQQRSFCHRSRCVCVEITTLNRSEVSRAEARRMSSVGSIAECRKPDTLLFVQPTTGAQICELEVNSSADKNPVCVLSVRALKRKRLELYQHQMQPMAVFGVY